MKTGKILKTFNAKDGRNVILRTPKWKDLDLHYQEIYKKGRSGVVT
jgi:hypothetical protein